jgi:DNA-binding NtrC family response regulator
VVASPGLPVEKQVVVPLEGALQLGRGAQVALLDQKLSRVHCSIYPLAREGEHAIKDLASRNGTFLNGERIDEERLTLGDVIRVGDSLLVYSRAPAQGAPTLPAPLVGASADLQDLGRVLGRIAPTDLTVLIEGPTGTGKEVVAHALHAQSGRNGPLLAINAAAVPHALFESEVFGYVRGAFTGAVSDSKGLIVNASGGTLFLDEIGDLSLDLQAKLLRVLETKTVRAVGGHREIPVDVRVVAATNVQLRARVDRGTFRGDLYARLSEASLTLTPLRDRPEDVLPLARSFLRESLGSARLPDFTPDLLETLMLSEWPFNVRELRSLVRRLSALHGEAPAWDVSMLPTELRAAVGGRASVGGDAASADPTTDPHAPAESELRTMLVRHAGNVKEVAAALGKGRTQVYRWLTRYGLRPETFRRRRGE